jgi:TonB family protein
MFPSRSRLLRQQATHIYPPEAARRHQQGTVVLMLYVNGSGTLDKIEIVKSSGFPLLDAAADKRNEAIPI